MLEGKGPLILFHAVIILKTASVSCQWIIVELYCVSICLCACACVRKREREGERDGEGEGERVGPQCQWVSLHRGGSSSSSSSSSGQVSICDRFSQSRPRSIFAAPPLLQLISDPSAEPSLRWSKEVRWCSSPAFSPLVSCCEWDVARSGRFQRDQVSEVDEVVALCCRTGVNSGFVFFFGEVASC